MLTSHFLGKHRGWRERQKKALLSPTQCSCALWVLLTLALLGSLLWHSPGLDTSLLKNHTMLPKTQQNSKEETGTLLAAGNA